MFDFLFKKKEDSSYPELLRQDAHDEAMKIVEDYHNRRDRSILEIHKMQSFMSVCRDMVNFFRDQIDPEDYKAWMLEENSACLPLSIKEFIT